MTTQRQPQHALHCAIACCFICFPAARAFAGDDLRSHLEALESKLAKVKDLAADFEEQKFSTLLRKPIVSRGTIKVVGDQSRWDTLEPRPTTMLTSPQEVKIYLPHSNTLEVYPVREYLQPVIVSPIPRMQTIERSFTVEPGEPAEPAALNIVLKPRQKQLAEFIDAVLVQIDESTGFARRVEMRSPDGDKTVLTFSNVRFNTGLSQADVELVPPENTRVVHPLSNHAEDQHEDTGRAGDR